ncbi:hypothetical protein [Profundibacter sp.]
MQDTESEAHRVEETLSEDDVRQAVLLSTGNLFRRVFNEYRNHIWDELGRITITTEGEKLRNDLISNTNSGFSNEDSFRQSLVTPRAIDVMFIIWRENGSISENAIKLAGLGRQFQHGKTLNRNSLKNAICNDLPNVSANGNDSIKRSIDRICQALEVYGLIERETERINHKPMHGTPRLHSLMSGAFDAMSRIFAKQLQEKDGAQND